MTGSLAWQLGLMGAEAAAAAALLLAVFSLRRVFGLAALYTSVGVLYYLATLLAGTTFVRATPDVLLSPGSVALFPAALFAVLLVYIREDAKEARNMIYGLLAANVLAALLGLVVSQHLVPGPRTLNPHGLPAELFVQSPRLFVAGLVALFADTILIILAYEALARRVRVLFVRAWAALALVLAFDTLVFVTGGFVEDPAYGRLLLSAIVGKVAAAVIYASALALYLRHAQPRHAGVAQLNDLFQVLTYRQKYEALREQASLDPLTGVHNRGHFDEQLRELVDAAQAGGAPAAVMMADVDHFKRINDNYGHSEGDRALRAGARRLRTFHRRGVPLRRRGVRRPPARNLARRRGGDRPAHPRGSAGRVRARRRLRRNAGHGHHRPRRVSGGRARERRRAAHGRPAALPRQGSRPRPRRSRLT